MGGIAGRSGPPGNRHAAGNRGGAPVGNSNSMTHGVSAFLKVSKFPPGAEYIENRLRTLKRSLQQDVIERDGEISLYAAGVMQSILRHEGRAQLLIRWLRREDEKLGVLDKAKLLADISTATEKRDAAMREIGLNRRVDEVDPWAQFDLTRDRDTLPPAIPTDPAGGVAADAPASAAASDVPIAHDDVEASPATPGGPESASLQPVVSEGATRIPATCTTATSEATP